MSNEDRDDKDSLQSLIAEILDTENRGEAVDRDSLLAEHPEHADSLREFFASHDQMKSAADIDPPTLPPRPSGPASEDPTIAPTASPLDDPTLPPTEPGGDDATLPPTGSASQKGEPTVGDKVRYFGDYELLEEIARGGMGVVYKARQMNLNRTVALKMILAGQFAGEEDVQRFYTEAEAAASLDHPGIVPIFEIGEHAEQHYFSMGFIEGDSLAQRVVDGPLPPREAAELVKKICDAMAYAHERGVIHRDLKPANILIDSNGQPKVTDFGLAKKTEADSGLTGTGQILGTPAYMPPEQASGKTEDVGPLADVYSLGAILYCLLTGRPPFQAASPMDTLLQVLDREPVAPRMLNSRTPRDLETICLKCLDKKEVKRYASADGLSAELNRFLSGEPIKARPISSPARAWRWCRRKPVVAGLSAAVVLTMVLGTAVSLHFGLQASRKAADALAQKTRAEAEAANALVQKDQALEQKRRAESLAYSTQVSSAIDALERKNVVVARVTLKKTQESLRGWEYRYLTNVLREDARVLKTRYSTCAAYGINGEQLVVGREDGTVSLFDVQTGAETDLGAAHKSKIVSISWPEPERIVAFAMDGTLASLNRADERGWTTFETNNPEPAYACFSKTAATFVSGSFSPTGGLFSLRDSRDGKVIHSFETGRSFVAPAAYCAEGEVIVSAGISTVAIWNASNGQQERTLRVPGTRTLMTSVAVAPHGTTVAACTQTGDLYLWNSASESDRPLILSGHEGQISSLMFSSDGQQLATCGADFTIRIWDVAGNELHVLSCSSPQLAVIAFEPRLGFLSTLSGHVKTWDLSRDLRLTPRESILPGEVAALTRDGSVAVIAKPGGFFGLGRRSHVVYDVVSQSELRTLPMKRVTPGALTSDRRLLATGFRDVQVWDMTTDKQLHEISRTAVENEDEKQPTVSVHAWGDRSRLALGWSDGATQIRSMPGNQIVTDIDGDGQQVAALAFALDDRRLAITRGKTLFVYDTDAGRELAKFEVRGNRTLAVSHDGNYIAFDGGKNLTIIDATDGKQAATLPLEFGVVRGIAFSPDGKRLACEATTSNAAIAIMFLDIETTTLIATIPVSKPAGAFNQRLLMQFAFSEDGSSLITMHLVPTSRQWTVRRWDSNPPNPSIAVPDD